MADRYIRAAGGNYNAAATWESAPGLNDSVSVPTSADAVIGHASSGNLTITAAAAAQSVDLSAYVGTLVINSSQTWTISGSVTLGAGMTWTATTGTISAAATGTWNSNGITIPCAMSFGTAVMTITLGASLTVNGTTSSSSTGNQLTLNGSSHTLRCNGSWTMPRPVAGDVGLLRFGGTGTLSGDSSTTRTMRVNMAIDTAGTITIGSNFRIGAGAAVLTYVAGTIVNGTIIINGNCTLDVNNAAMAGVSYSVDGVSTITLSNPLTCNQFGLGSNTTMSGAHAVTCNTLLYFATATLTRVNSWTVGTLQVNSGAFTATLAGAFDQAVTDLSIFSGAAVALTSGQTLSVSGVIFMTANGTTATATLRSVTASSPITLDYTGGYAGNRVFRATFTDVNMAAGQRLWNYHGQTLTRTNGIVNFTRPPVHHRSEVYHVS